MPLIVFSSGQVKEEIVLSILISKSFITMLNCELEDKVSELSFVELTISIDITLLKNRLQLFLPFFIIKWSHL